VVLEFLQHRLQDEVDGFKLGDVDRELFAEIVRGVHAEQRDLDDMITAVIAEGWEVERLERLLRIILRAGTFELAYREKVPARTVINEYVGIADSFFSGKEPGMVNGMLDRLGRDLRSEEFEGR
jgi:N utilization substance protein B